MDEHELTLARIEDERVARSGLEGKRMELVKVKDALVKKTTAQKEELGRLDTELEKWIQGAEGPRKMLEAMEKQVAEKRAAEAKEREEAAAAAAEMEEDVN